MYDIGLFQRVKLEKGWKALFLQDPPPIQFSKETEKLIWTHRPCIIYMKYQIKA